MEEDFCTYENIHGVSSGIDNWEYWDVCNKCGKVIEDSYRYFNHYDGEDHCNSY